MLSIKATCKRLGISRWTVSTLIKTGEIEAIKAPGGKNASVKVIEESLERYIARQTINPDDVTAERAS